MVSTAGFSSFSGEGERAHIPGMEGSDEISLEVPYLENEDLLEHVLLLLLLLLLISGRMPAAALGIPPIRLVLLRAAGPAAARTVRSMLEMV
jgi:hypothetical protein